jgi:peptidyl-prolyl cis-trans isomerase SurA
MRWVCVIFLLGLVLCPNSPAEPELRNGIAAIVNDSIITFQEVEAYTVMALDALHRTYARQPEVYQKKRLETLTSGLEDLLVKQLILHDFKTAGGVLPESVIDDEIKDRIRRRFGDRVTLTKTLQAEGITQEAYRQRTRDEIVVGYMTDRNIRSAILISPQKIERYYQTNLHQFKLGDQVKLRMIVLNRPTGSSSDEVKKLALEIAQKIDQGASFAEMASVYSEGSQRKEGGDWGWVEETKLNKGLAEIAFGLKPGKHSSVLALAREPDDSYWIYQYNPAGRLSVGRKYTSRDVFVEEKRFEEADERNVLPPREFYLMLVEDKRVARTKSLQEARDEIEKTLILQERARLQKKWVDRLRAKSFIRYF